MEHDEYWNADKKTKTVFDDDWDEETDTIQFMGTTREEIAALSRTVRSDADISFKKYDDTIVSEGGSQSVRFKPTTTLSSSHLEKVKEATKSEKQKSLDHLHDSTLSPDRMVWKIISGQPYTLDIYKSKHQKLALLDCAIESHDGNAITAVILYIKSTLKRLLFHQILREKPQALNHYIAFLRSENEFNKLTDILSMVGRTEDAAILNYKLAAKSQHLKTKVMEMKKCHTNHFANDPILEFNSSLVLDHISLLERQAPIDDSDESTQKHGNNEIFQRFPKSTTLINSSVITTLYYCCLYHYGLTENHLASPDAIRKVHRISDKQFIWTAVSARARVQRWTDIEHIMSTKNFFGTSRKIKFHFNPEAFIEILKNNKASREILSKYISCIDDAEAKLKLAKKCECHPLVIELLVGMKDRVQLEAYKSKLLAHSSDRQSAQDALNSSTIRWKN